MPKQSREPEVDRFERIGRIEDMIKIGPARKGDARLLAYARYAEARGLRPGDILAMECGGEADLDEYAREHDLPVPLDLSRVDLADLFKEKPFAIHASRARLRLHLLISAALELDAGADGAIGVRYVPGKYDDKGEGRHPCLLISPELARFPFKSRTLKKALRRFQKADSTPATDARKELKRVLNAIGETKAFTPDSVPWGVHYVKAVDEKKILAELSAWLRDERERRQRVLGSFKAADASIARDIGCPAETVRGLARA